MAAGRDAESSGNPLTTSPLRIDERILHYLAGVHYQDERLAGFIHPVAIDRGAGAIARDAGETRSGKSGSVRMPRRRSFNSAAATKRPNNRLPRRVRARRVFASTHCPAGQFPAARPELERFAAVVGARIRA